MNENVRKAAGNFILFTAIAATFYWLLLNFGYTMRDSLVCEGIGGIITISFHYIQTKKKYQDEKFKQVNTSIKELDNKKVETEVFDTEMENIEKRFQSKAENSRVDGLEALMKNMNLNIKERFDDLKQFIRDNK